MVLNIRSADKKKVLGAVPAVGAFLVTVTTQLIADGAKAITREVGV